MSLLATPPDFRISHLCFALAIGLMGCGDSSRVNAPSFDPQAIASGAIAAYDADSSGSLEKGEYKVSPFTAERWDEDGNGAISESEIVARLERYVEKRTGLMDVTCQVSLNGRELENATVEFVPEDYMGGVVESAEGITDVDGRATPAIPEVVAKDSVLTGIRPGLYRVKVTHASTEIPTKYNTETTLFFDASPLDVVFSAIPLKLRK